MALLNEMLVNAKWLTVALAMMREIAQDTGAINTSEVEQYPYQHQKLISDAAKIFFESHPTLLNEEIVTEICTGEHGDKIKKYGLLHGYSQLDEALNNWFYSI